MKINFTKKQFKILMDLVTLGNMVINGIRTPDEMIKEYEELENYIYSFSKDFDYKDLVEYEKKFDKYFPTKKYEEEIEEFIDEYDYHVFKDKLYFRLAKRDINREMEAKNTEEDFEKHMLALFEQEDKYKEEFYENGLENLKYDIINMKVLIYCKN